MKKLFRRKFLEAGAVSSVAMIGGTAAQLPILEQQGEAQKQNSPHEALESRTRDVLHSAMDEIIPAGDGMPAASEVGGIGLSRPIDGPLPEGGRRDCARA